MGNAFPHETSHYSCIQNENFENWFFETLILDLEPFSTNKTSFHIFTKYNPYASLSIRIA
jgi:hypothetical protein